MTEQEKQLLNAIRGSKDPAGLLELALREIISRLPPERRGELRPFLPAAACGTTE